ncbi:Beta-lactamase class C-like and penicillin binding proteins (PBPs) superfamily [Olavius algarvensis associated proteobacterium Delta 3]|nr:Beta-lactamase class C-like and penicillin binding proteins (PBPs) superfamily [Olavius algarvensis associated proteobacterium Delta 3]CAB5157961.1 Beta-lactamase class C-like and penicillin binding proteins (PBPs) superfamily [Olavius algarvensis associated proteobacterium Delta 3]
MQNMKHVDQMMRQAVVDGVFPGGVLLASREGRIHFQGAYGTANAVSGEPVTHETVFDLASLTKPLCTTLAVIHLIQNGRLKPDDPIGHFLPELKTSGKGAIHIEHLLRHTSGLPEYRPYFETLRDVPGKERKHRLWGLLATEPLESGIGAETRYSDPGFLMLQQVIETVSGTCLDRLAEKTIFEPLGIKKLFFAGPETTSAGIYFAATEDCPWRRRILQGEVHDDNAWIIGGVAGHAGLFGDIAGVYLLLTELLRTWHGHFRQSVFSPGLVRNFLSTDTPGIRAMGFDTPSMDGPSCGRYFSPHTVGHLGFTGTSFWMDLTRKIIVILLTNRIHPTRENLGIREFRPRIHDAVMAALL